MKVSRLPLLFLFACALVVVSCSEDGDSPVTPNASDLLMCVHPYFFSGVTGTSYTFEMDSRFAPGDVYCEWQFGSDGEIVTTQGETGSIQHEFSSAGVDTLFVRLYDKETDGLLRTILKYVTIRETADGGELVAIPGGTFSMGNVSSYDGVSADLLARELPVRTVELSAFHMSETEVTQADFEHVMGFNPVPENFRGDQLPVGSVDWISAIAYCNRRSIMEGLTPVYSFLDTLVSCDTVEDASGIGVDASANGYRLPTEAEWEYAARAGAETQLYSGSLEIGGLDCTTASAQLDDIAWYCGSSNSTIHEVGQLTPNEFGLFDMSGNVREWVWDFWSANYEGLGTLDPTGPSEGEAHVLRGGSFLSYPHTLRSAARAKGTLSSGDTFVSYGFRVVRNQ